jgi:hypothetical protein
MAQVKIDQGKLDEISTILRDIENGAARALMRAINRVLAGVKTDLSTETRKILNLKKARVDQDIHTRQASLNRMTASVVSQGRTVGLATFTGTREVRKGVSASVRKDRPRKIIPRAFLATLRHGNVQAAWRKWHDAPAKPVRPAGDKYYGKLPKKYRLPMATLYGPRIQDIQDDYGVIEPVQAKAWDRLRARLDHEVNFLLKKANPDV